MSKVTSMEKAIHIINHGDSVAIGGNVLHRVSHAAVREIIKQQKKNLEIIKTAGAHDVDILCAAGTVESVSAGYISYETEYGLCNHYRKAVENGEVIAKEHACYTVISGLRAAIQGIPFIPVRGITGSDLIEARGFKFVKDPYSNEELVAVQAIQPDVSIIHVQEADSRGNARISGPKYEDVLMAKSAKKVIITCEKIVSTETFNECPQCTDIQEFLVTHVVEVSDGAKPGSCAGVYDIDGEKLNKFKKLKTKEDVINFVNTY